MKKVLSQVTSTKPITPKAITTKTNSYKNFKSKGKNCTYCPTISSENNEQNSTGKKSDLEYGVRMLTEENHSIKRNILKTNFRGNNNKNQLAISTKNFTKKKQMNINTSGHNSVENLSNASHKSVNASDKDNDHQEKERDVRKIYIKGSKPIKKEGNVEKKEKEIIENGHIKKVSINLNENNINTANCNTHSNTHSNNNSNSNSKYINPHRTTSNTQVKKRMYNEYSNMIKGTCHNNNNNNHNLTSAGPSNHLHQNEIIHQPLFNGNHIKNDEPAPSQVFSSISTFSTLVNINSKERKHISTSSQFKELEELNKKLQLIRNQNNNENNNKSGHYNIINAEMLEKDSHTFIPLQNKEEDISPKNSKEITLSSNQRIQTYQLLLSCINSKFSEIQEIVENNLHNRQFTDTNLNRDTKVSELHSKIEFTQDIINPNQNSYDYIDDMQEKSNMIVPKGAMNPNNITENITINFNTAIAKKRTKELSNFDITSSLNNSDILSRAKGDYDDKKLVSFLSNEMMSFFQPSIITDKEKIEALLNNGNNGIGSCSSNILKPLKNSLNKNKPKHEATPSLPLMPIVPPSYAYSQDSIIDMIDDDEEQTTVILSKEKKCLIPNEPKKIEASSGGNKCAIF